MDVCNALAEGHKDWNSKQRRRCPVHGERTAAGRRAPVSPARPSAMTGDVGAPSGADRRAAIMVLHEAPPADSHEARAMLARASNTAAAAQRRVDARRAARHAAAAAGWDAFDIEQLEGEFWQAHMRDDVRGDRDYARVVSDVAFATAAAGLAGHHGFTQDHLDVLREPYDAGMSGPAADAPYKESQVRRHLESAFRYSRPGDGNLVAISKSALPADALEAAKRALGSADVTYRTNTSDRLVYGRTV